MSDTHYVIIDLIAQNAAELRDGPDTQTVETPIAAGPYDNREDAQKVLKQMESDGPDDFAIVDLPASKGPK